ncbi:MAG: hypothetical protein GF353_05045 [Candidatus Lokiarchaeota archaeon]|nr:hypothetical protein [Candidatus Lokiarchaeota archaeon]
MNPNCFVIQPFDTGKFDKRFNDIFEPAIKSAGLFPYRVDRDPSVRIPVEDIEKKIHESKICFAEITTDNPNVWYELGYAFACGKDVVMVCSDERSGKFPFDIQHKQIIKYSTTSKSDYENLESAITEKIGAFLKVSKTIDTLNIAPVKEREGLKSHEIAILILLMENSLTRDDSYSLHLLKDDMNKAGYTDIATSIAVRTLSEKNMIETFKAVDEYHNNEEYIASRLLSAGEKWILENQDKIEFRIKEQDHNEDDLPF